MSRGEIGIGRGLRLCKEIEEKGGRGRGRWRGRDRTSRVFIGLRVTTPKALTRGTNRAAKLALTPKTCTSQIHACIGYVKDRNPLQHPISPLRYLVLSLNAYHTNTAYSKEGA